MPQFPDLSGGYITTVVSSSVVQHHVRVHVAPFSNVFPYTYTTARGTEATVSQTAGNLQPLIAACYSTTTTIGQFVLTQQASPGVFNVVGGVGPTAVAGTATGANSSPSFCAILTWRTKAGRFLKVELCSTTAVSLATKTSALAPTALVNLSSYITGANTNVMGKDGNFASQFAGLSAENNKKLLRKYLA